MNAWNDIKGILKASGTLKGQREQGLAEPGNVAEIIPILRNELIDENAIAKALYEFDSHETLNQNNFGDEEYASAHRGYSNRGQYADAWVVIGGKCFSSNPLAQSVYDYLHQHYPRQAQRGLGFITKNLMNSNWYKQIKLVTEDSGVEVVNVEADQLIDKIFTECYRAGASDIHIGMGSTGQLEVRRRIDGALTSYRSYKAVDLDVFSNRLWERCKEGLLRKNIFQNGQFNIKIDGELIDVRVNKMPAKVNNVECDKYACRLLRSDSNLNTLDQFGLSEEDLNRFRYAFKRSNGLILITGPTGSGKTTLIQAGIRYHRQEHPTRSILSAEDPIEKNMEGVDQTQVREDLPGRSWRDVVKEFMRHDPDTMFIGEIRSKEVASSALDGAVTGHLVISTIHVDNAHNTVERLLDLGLERSKIIDRMVLFTSQRLLKKLCPHCKEETSLEEYHLEYQYYRQLLSEVSDNGMKIFKANPAGCSSCIRGYSGRIQVIEMLTPSVELADVVYRNEIPISEFRRMQIEAGTFKDLNYKALKLVGDGVIDIGEMSSCPDIQKDYPHLIDL